MLGHALKIVDERAIERFDSDDWARLTVLLVQPQSTAEKRETSATLSPATGRGRAQQLIALWQVCRIAGQGDPGLDYPLRRQGDNRDLRQGEPTELPCAPTPAWGGARLLRLGHRSSPTTSSTTSTGGSATRPRIRRSASTNCARTCSSTWRRSPTTTTGVPGSRNLNGGFTLAAAPMARRVHGVYDANLAFWRGAGRAGSWQTPSSTTRAVAVPAAVRRSRGRDGVPRPWRSVPGGAPRAGHLAAPTRPLRDVLLVRHGHAPGLLNRRATAGLPEDRRHHPSGRNELRQPHPDRLQDEEPFSARQKVVNGRSPESLLQLTSHLLGLALPVPNTGEPVLFSQRSGGAAVP